MFKKILIFIYSALITYFVIYKVIWEEYYYIQLGGGDWGYATVIVGWILMKIAHLPIVLIALKDIDTKQNSLKKYLFRNYAIPLLPSIIGLIILIIFTFTGRALFQPLYNTKINQIQKKVHMYFSSIKIEKKYDSKCSCISSKLIGTAEIDSNLDFPAVLEMKKSYDNPPGDSCIMDGGFVKELANGSQSIVFDCGYRYPEKINQNTDKFIFVITEKKNVGVKMEKTVSYSDFSRKEGL